MVKDSFGDDVASSVENVKSDHPPLILVVCKVGGKLEVQNIIQGHTDLDSLMGHLLMAMEVHEENQSNEIVEEVRASILIICYYGYILSPNHLFKQAKEDGQINNYY